MTRQFDDPYLVRGQYGEWVFDAGNGEESLRRHLPLRVHSRGVVFVTSK